MKIRKIKKKFITLVEMMIVMFLIAMITGVIAYNYTGSLEEGKAFKTAAGIEKIKTVLALEAATRSLDEVVTNWQSFVRRSPLVQNPDELLRDGWGQSYEVSASGNGDEIIVTSQKYDQHLNKDKSTLFRK